MSKLLRLLAAVIVFTACNEKKETAKKYPDFFLGNLKGDVESLQDSLFIVDSSGNVKPDSVVYELHEYKNAVLLSSTRIDTTGKFNAITTYDHFENGLLKGMETFKNGKRTYQLKIQLDSNDEYTSAQSFDTSGKTDYFNTDITQNENGQLTGGKLFKADSSFVYAFTSSYEGKNNTGSVQMDSSGKVTLNNVSKFNDKGDAIWDSTSTIVKDSATATVKKFNYVYDETGNWIEVTELNSNGKPVKITRRKIIYVKK